MTEQSSLTDFEPGPRDSKPVFTAYDGVEVPESAETSGTAGWFVGHNRPGTGYLTARIRGDDVSTVDGCHHYHYLTSGYPISTEILDLLEQGTAVVTTIYVAELDTGTLYEFEFDQYLAGEEVNADEPQLSVPATNAVKKWNDSVPEWCR